MNEFRGTVRLDQPFLEQPEVAEFLQPSPGDSFPRSAMYRLLSVSECFLQARLAEQSLTKLRLNCEFLKSDDEAKNLESYSIEWTQKTSCEDILDSEVLEPYQIPEETEIRETLDALAERIHEVLILQAVSSKKEEVTIQSYLSVDLATPTPVAAPPPVRFAFFAPAPRFQWIFHSVQSSVQVHRSCKRNPNNPNDTVRYLVDTSGQVTGTPCPNRSCNRR